MWYIHVLCKNTEAVVVQRSARTAPFRTRVCVFKAPRTYTPVLVALGPRVLTSRLPPL